VADSGAREQVGRVQLNDDRHPDERDHRADGLDGGEPFLGEQERREHRRQDRAELKTTEATALVTYC
jgi:hypothetical protein